MLRAMFFFFACTDGESEDKETGTQPSESSPACDLIGYDLREAINRAFAGTMEECDLEAIAAWNEFRKEELAGPYNEDVRLATSTDGSLFTDSGESLVAHAGVPEAVRGDDGRVYLYYLDGDLDAFLDHAANDPEYLRTHGWVGIGGFGASVSDDDGRSFTRLDEFEIEGVLQGQIVDPDVIRLPDGSWRMYYVGLTVEESLSETGWLDDTPHDVYIATSTDLIHWVQEPEPLFNGPYADPSVHCPTETDCMMAAFGIDRGRSEDGGITWDFFNDNFPRGYGPDFFDPGDGSTLMFYNTTETHAPVATMVSEDGLSWVDDGHDLVPDYYMEAPSVIFGQDGTWLLYAHGYTNGLPPIPDTGDTASSD